MGRIFYHGVRVRWNDGSAEMFRYDTEDEAREAERFQFVENWTSTKHAVYVGRRIHWAGLWQALIG